MKKLLAFMLFGLGISFCGSLCNAALFVRGDVNASGEIDITDPICVLNNLFLGSCEFSCLDSADVDDDGSVNLTDAIFLLGFLFNGSGQPPPPFPECGNDLVEDQLRCEAFISCASGCTDDAALNHDAEANVDDGSCLYEDWVVRFSLEGESDERASAIALDNENGIYAVGSVRWAQGVHVLVVKYGSDGSRLWARTYPNYSAPVAPYVDRAGNLYLIGANPHIVKLDSAGNELWAARKEGLSWGSSTFESEVSAGGDIYIVGVTERGETHGLVKFDADGEELWTQPLPSLQSINRPDRLSLDSDGNAYIGWRAGGRDNSTGYLTLKFSPLGNQLWAAIYEPIGAFGTSTQTEVDSQGNVYVSGWLGAGRYYPATTIKYDSEGKELWVANYPSRDGAPDTTIPVGLSTDAEGNAIVLCQPTSVVKYDPNGNELWVSRGSAGLDEFYADLVVDRTGRVFVTGRHTTARGRNDIYTFGLDAAGRELFSNRYDGPDSGVDEPSDIAVDNSGNVFVLGTSQSSRSGRDLVLIKFSAAGIGN